MEITYWRSAKVPTVQYGARDICLTLKSLVENGKENEEYNRLKEFVDARVEEQASSVVRDLTGIKFREKEGRKYWRVSSILNPDPPPNIPNFEKYGIRGTEYHRLINHWLLTFEWLKPQADVSPLKYDLKVAEFFDEHIKRFHPVVDGDLNIEVFNERLGYSGEIDLLCKVDNLISIVDFKTGSWKLEQLVAYAKCVPLVEQLVICDLKKNELLTWSMDDQEVYNAEENFLVLLGRFKERFNLT